MTSLFKVDRDHDHHAAIVQIKASLLLMELLFEANNASDCGREKYPQRRKVLLDSTLNKLH